MSFREIGVPTNLYWLGVLTGADPVTARLNGWSPTSSPYLTERFEPPTTETTPFVTDKRSTGVSRLFDASRSNACRASAAAARICGEPRLIAALEYVPP